MVLVEVVVGRGKREEEYYIPLGKSCSSHEKEVQTLFCTLSLVVALQKVNPLVILLKVVF